MDLQDENRQAQNTVSIPSILYWYYTVITIYVVTNVITRCHTASFSVITVDIRDLELSSWNILPQR